MEDNPSAAREPVQPEVVQQAPAPEGEGRDESQPAEQVTQPTKLVRVVPVHPHPEPDRLLGHPRGVGQDPLLAQAHELGDAIGLDIALALEAQLAFDVHLNPESLAVEAVLVTNDRSFRRLKHLKIEDWTK